MVYLHRIYTKTGDTGETSLGDGSRVKKTSERIVAYGTVDELNSAVGLAIAAGIPPDPARWLEQIQNDLFDLGADLCVPLPASPPPQPALRVTADQVTQLEHWLDQVTDQLQPLTSFVLPGGTPGAAFLHVARTVCRRAEIEVLRLAATTRVNPQVAIYLNRLSDLLFVLARQCNNGGRGDRLWIPGANRSS